MFNNLFIFDKTNEAKVSPQYYYVYEFICYL